MLFAKTTPIISFKYSLLNDIVKKLKQWSILADIFFIKKNFKIDITENLSNDAIKNIENIENIKSISVSVPFLKNQSMTINLDII